MAKKEKENKNAKVASEVLQPEKPEENLSAMEAKYNQLINEIKPKLLTKAQLKQGGRDVRSRYEKEKGYEVLIPEINALGKKLGKPPIGLGELRK